MSLTDTSSGAIERARPSGVIARLLKDGWRFDFFQAVWLIEQHLAGATPIGERGPVASEGIRFRPHVSLGFPATDVRRVELIQAREREASFFRVEVTFLGLYGVATPLPLHYAIRILRSVDTGQPEPTAPEAGAAVASVAAAPTPARDFLDLLHHRLLSLFYRAWTKYRYHVSFALPHRDSITDYLLWLIGSQPTWDQALLGVSPLRLLRYADALTQRPRSAARLRGLLVDYWKKIPVEVEQVVGRWVPLHDSDLNRVGVLNSRLGVDLTVGEQVFDLGGAFRIVLGPVGWEEYVGFLPDGERFAQTKRLVSLYCTDPFSFSIEIRLRAGEAPALQLSSDVAAARLGYTSWPRTAELRETAVSFEAA